MDVQPVDLKWTPLKGGYWLIILSRNDARVVARVEREPPTAQPSKSADRAALTAESFDVASTGTVTVTRWLGTL
jgi:hypothetical protein